MSEQTPKPDAHRGGLSPVTVHREAVHGGPIALLGEGVGHPGLAITPTLGALYSNDAHGWKGWSITHVPSGWAVAQFDDEPIDYVRVIAWTLADSGVDWSQPSEELIGNPHAKDAMRRAYQRAHEDARFEATR